ncbi:polyprotein [Sclerophthora macrospora virus B]|uniref:polyprotein n=1 Tax=Sclerophthora macrospora virus B TaxID=75914 RepID=UPI00000ED8F2|nr:polyprotein [Sclerophthora macrospora virus B]BAA72177.1 polyprotein [Sclerophthora macrospora virus B]
MEPKTQVNYAEVVGGRYNRPAEVRAMRFLASNLYGAGIVFDATEGGAKCFTSPPPHPASLRFCSVRGMPALAVCQTQGWWASFVLKSLPFPARWLIFQFLNYCWEWVELQDRSAVFTATTWTLLPMAKRFMGPGLEYPEIGEDWFDRIIDSPRYRGWEVVPQVSYLYQNVGNCCLSYSAHEKIVAFVTELYCRFSTYGIYLSARTLRQLSHVHHIKYMVMLQLVRSVPVARALSTGDAWDLSLVFARFLEWERRWSLSLLDLIAPYLNFAWRDCVSPTLVKTDVSLGMSCSKGTLVTFPSTLSLEFSQGLKFNVFEPSELCCEERHHPLLTVSMCLAYVLLWYLIIQLVIISADVVLDASKYICETSLHVCQRFATLLSSLLRWYRLKIDRSLVRDSRVVTSCSGEAPPVYRLVSKGPEAVDSLEMSMRGSEIRTSVAIPGCLYLAVVHDSDVIFIGMAFRYKGYLVTAQHNILAMSSAPGKYYVLPFRPGKDSEFCYLDQERMIELTSVMLHNDIVSEEFQGYDVAIIPIAAAAWSCLGVKSLLHADATWGINVTLYGLEKTGKRKLQRSLGTIREDKESPLHSVYYNASTLRGWSGSPVLNGHKRVVALHCGTNGQVNRGLNFAFVRFIIEIHEINTRESSTDSYEDEIEKSFRTRGGYLSRRQEELEVERRVDEGIAVYKRYIVSQSSRGIISFCDSDYVDRQRATHTATTNVVEQVFDDNLESSYSPKCIQRCRTGEAEKSEDLSSAEQLFDYHDGDPFVASRVTTRLSAPHYKGRPERYDEHVDLSRAKELGYDPEEYGMPRATDRTSAIKRSAASLSKSLEDAIRTSKFQKPSEDLRSAAVSIMMDTLSSLRYPVDGSGVTRDKIASQLNSSAVGDGRSPGLPYASEFPTNRDLLSKFSVDELADLIYTKYREDRWEQPSINFLKIEPTKVEKLDQGLDRCVQAVGLDTQLYFRCHFGALADVASANYRKSPVMQGWSPLKPGDGHYLYNVITRNSNRKILEYDGKAFEYVAHTAEAYSDVTDVIIGLSTPAVGANVDKVREWRSEAQRFMMRVGESGYLLADGTLVSKRSPFVLSSGRWDTFLRNSLTGYYWLIIGLLDAGYTADDIKAKFLIKVGGDDVILSVPSNFDTQTFTSALGRYGMKIHKVKLKPITDDFEFFSWKFSKNSRGLVQWTPTRFSKHLENFFNTKHEDRHQALVSHMMNWVHSEPHYNFFREIYMRGRESEPDIYELSKIPERRDLLFYLRGNESVIKDWGSVGAFVSLASAAVLKNN